jgi:glycosyltransferase involved in cell wall biosynthesis
MKILVVANESRFISKFKLELLQQLILKSHQVIVVCDDKYKLLKNMSGEITLYDIPTNNRSLNPLSFVRLILRYNSIILKHNPDVIISFTVKPNIIMGMISRYKKIHQIQTITGLGSGYHNSKILRLVIMLMYRISTSDYLVRFHENSSIKNVFKNSNIRAKIDLVINGSGVNLVKYSILPMTNNLVCVFTFIGRVMKEKGILELLEAASLLDEKGINFRILIVGDITNFPIKDLNISNRIEICGYREDIVSVLERTDCLIHPSHHEGMANVVLEASASGRPSIVSNIPGCKEEVVDGITGYTFEVKNAHDLADKMIRFINLEPSIKQNMGIEARAHVAKFFNRNDVNQDYIKAIDDIHNELMKGDAL